MGLYPQYDQPRLYLANRKWSTLFKKQTNKVLIWRWKKNPRPRESHRTTSRENSIACREIQDACSGNNVEVVHSTTFTVDLNGTSATKTHIARIRLSGEGFKTLKYVMLKTLIYQNDVVQSGYIQKNALRLHWGNAVDKPEFAPARKDERHSYREAREIANGGAIRLSGVRSWH